MSSHPDNRQQVKFSFGDSPELADRLLALVLAVQCKLPRRGKFDAFAIQPDIRAAAGALERADRQVYLHRLARREVGEAREAAAFPHARRIADLEERRFRIGLSVPVDAEKGEHPRLGVVILDSPGSAEAEVAADVVLEADGA